MLAMTAFRPLQDLQSSMFKEEGMGSTVLATMYGSVMFSALFIATPLINLLGMLWCHIWFIVI